MEIWNLFSERAKVKKKNIAKDKASKRSFQSTPGTRKKNIG